MSMAHAVDGDPGPANFEVHFLHSDNPRDGLFVMSTSPLVCYEFRTPIGFLTTHTIVTDASGATVMTFNWFGPSALGTMIWPGPPPYQGHMGDLVQPVPSRPDTRGFLCESPDQIIRRYWWRRVEHGNYDLFAVQGVERVIGYFRKHQPPEVLSIGINYATFYFQFQHEPLLLRALLALCLNRWLDAQGSAN